MSKLRVSELANEFGIEVDDVIALLRQMDVSVRGPQSVVADDQVARIRARWEREKRARAQREAAPAVEAAPKRRRTTKAAAPAPEPAAPAAAEPVVRRRRRAATAESEPQPEAQTETVEAAPQPVTVAPPAPAAPKKAEPVVAQPEAPEAPAAPVAPSRPETPKTAVPIIEREVLPPLETERPAAAQKEAEAPAPVRHEAPRPQTAQRPTPAASATPVTYSSDRGTQQADRPRPRPITPGAPRGRQAPARGGFVPPRPVASAAPGGGVATPRREEQQSRNKPQGTGPMADRNRRKKGKRVDQEAVDANISKTMAAMRGAPSRRNASDFARRGAREEAAAEMAAAAEREKRLVRVNEFITVSELAQILKISPTEIVSFAFKTLGLMVTINQRLDFDQIELIAGEFGFQAVREDEYQAEEVLTAEEDTAEQLQSRPPVVTIMGHVDHGKTSLLDYIRKANVVAGEAGGITQHIGAYNVAVPGGRHITFLDTPGHEAFTAMRARGAQVTDLVVLVVAADDGIMPQTVEAISHAKNAGVPVIVAVNKIDLPQANPGRVKQELLQHGVVLEEFGGQVLSQEISAKKGTNVDALLETVLLQSDVLDLKANPDRRAVGTVVEAQLDPGKGPVATVLVQNGTLHVGDDFICGLYSGRVRALLDERGKTVKEAGPAIPVQVLGMNGVPMAGDQLIAVEDAAASREIAQRRQRLDREAKSRRTSRAGVSLEDFTAAAAAGEMRTLRVLIKADQGGPAEALADALQQLSGNEVRVEVIHRGVGAITESDILLAKASGAIIIGFHVRPDNNARAAAERENVDIRLYRVIYDAVNEVRAALEGMLRPEQREVILGEAQVRETFKVSRVGVIAGCSVRSGIINRTGRVRVIRDGVEVYDGVIGSLRRFKEDVREVREGFECGIGVENFNDIKIGDVIECYRTEEVARTLEGAAQG